MTKPDQFLSEFDPSLRDIGYDAVGLLALRHEVRAHGGIGGIFNILRQRDAQALRVLERYSFLLSTVADPAEISQPVADNEHGTDSDAIHPAVQERVDRLADEHDIDHVDAKLLFIAAKVYSTAFPEEAYSAMPNQPPLDNA